MRDNWITTNLFQMADSLPKSFVDGDWIESPYITDEGIRLIQTGNIGIGQFKGKSKKYISEKSFKQLNCTEVFPGDLLICRLAEPAGRACIVPNLDERFITSVDVSIFRPNNSYSKEFIHQLLNTDSFLNKVEILSGGSTRQRISRTNLGSINLNLPPLPQQRKIAKILSTCDTVIAKTEEAIAKYQAIKQGMMHDLFTRGIDLSTGKLRPKYQDAPELYKPARLAGGESESGMIPKDWEVKRLEEISTVVTGNTPSTSNKKFYDGGIMFVSPYDVNDNKYIKQTQTTLSNLGLSVSRKIPKNSISVVCIGSTIGKVGITTDLCSTNQQINTIIPFEDNLSDFIYYSCKNFLIKQLSIEAGLQAVPIVNKSTFERLILAFPMNEKESQGISVRLSSIDDKIKTEKDSLAKYHQIKSGLMQDLLSGKVEVSVSKEEEIVNA